MIIPLIKCNQRSLTMYRKFLVNVFYLLRSEEYSLSLCRLAMGKCFSENSSTAPISHRTEQTILPFAHHGQMKRGNRTGDLLAPSVAGTIVNGSTLLATCRNSCWLLLSCDFTDFPVCPPDSSSMFVALDPGHTTTNPSNSRLSRQFPRARGPHPTTSRPTGRWSPAQRT